MGYDIGGGYDAWKTATPWDDEKSFNVSFTCTECEAEHEDVEAVGGRYDEEVLVDCNECGVENSVSVGGD
jgi:hypothetical protein